MFLRQLRSSFASGLKKQCLACSVLLALMTFLGAWYFLFDEVNDYTRLSLVLPAGFLLIAVFFHTVLQISNPLLSLAQEGLLGFLFVLFSVTGAYFESGRYLASLSFGSAGLLLLRAVLLTPLASGILRLLCCALCARSSQGETGQRKMRLWDWLVPFLIILAVWAVVWLAYRPGFFNYDAWQVDEVLNHRFSRHHPLLHTLLLGHCYKLGLSLGDPNAGVALYCAVQGILLAAILALSCAFLRSRGRRFLSALSLLFYAFFPANSILAISTTKDVLFSGFILLALLLALSCDTAGSKRAAHVLAVIEVFLLALIQLMRNNAQYAVLLTLPVCLLFFRRKRWRTLFLVFAAGFALFKVSDAALTRMLSAAPGEIAEAFSIPIQQCGRIYTRLAEDGEDEETQAEIAAFFDMDKAYYRPERSDLMKFYTTVDRENAAAFLKLSAKLFLRYPLESIDAVLCLTKGAWDVGDLTYAEAYRGVSDRAGVLFTDIKPGYGIHEESALPGLERALERLVSENAFTRIPLLPLLFSPAFYVWLFLLVFAMAVFGPARAYAPFLPFFFFLLLTILAGPCIIVRYVYPFMVCMPVFLYMLSSCRPRR